MRAVINCLCEDCLPLCMEGRTVTNSAQAIPCSRPIGRLVLNLKNAMSHQAGYAVHLCTVCPEHTTSIHDHQYRQSHLMSQYNLVQSRCGSVTVAGNAHVYSCNASGVADSNLLNAAAANRHAVVCRGQTRQKLLNAVGGV